MPVYKLIVPSLFSAVTVIFLSLLVGELTLVDESLPTAGLFVKLFLEAPAPINESRLDGYAIVIDIIF